MTTQKRSCGRSQGWGLHKRWLAVGSTVRRRRHAFLLCASSPLLSPGCSGGGMLPALPQPGSPRSPSDWQRRHTNLQQGRIRTENTATNSLVGLRKPFLLSHLSKPEQDNFIAAACHLIQALPGTDVLVAGVLGVGTGEATSTELCQHIWSGAGA